MTVHLAQGQSRKPFALVLACGLAAWSLCMPHSLNACDPIAYQSCDCSAGCQESYCEKQCSLLRCWKLPDGSDTGAYICGRCMCGALGRGPQFRAGTLFAALASVSRQACAAEGGRPAAVESEPAEEARQEASNEHGDFLLIGNHKPADDSSGIGVRLTTVGRDIRISEVVPDSPAEKSGLLVDDIVTSVDGRSMRGAGLKTAALSMRGRQGTLVVLRVRRSVGKKTIFKKIPLIRGAFAIGEESPGKDPAIRIETIPRGDKECPKEKAGNCLFLFEESGECMYSCRARPD